MTDNIQKLYEIAGVPRIYSEFNNGKETVVENVFSPYRQLELIKWVSDIFVFRTFTRLKKETYCFLTEREYGCDEYFCKDVTFSQALAGLILQLWDELTDTQKKEIKEILECI